MTPKRRAINLSWFFKSNICLFVCLFVFCCCCCCCFLFLRQMFLGLHEQETWSFWINNLFFRTFRLSAPNKLRAAVVSSWKIVRSKILFLKGNSGVKIKLLWMFGLGTMFQFLIMLFTNSFL